MNLRLVSKLIGIVAILIGLTMSMSLPWAFSGWGRHTINHVEADFESSGFIALLISMFVSVLVGGCFYFYGREAKSRLFLKEAMAVVALSWMMATILGALPYLLSGTYRGPSVRLFTSDASPVTCGSNWRLWGQWDQRKPLTNEQAHIVRAILNAGHDGLNPEQFEIAAAELKSDKKRAERILRELKEQRPVWNRFIILPGDDPDNEKLSAHFRIRWIRMGLADALFESQSGFSTTGATVISDLENPDLIPRCILFWRSLTHFLGGLGIIVLFVTILGQGSAGKALMRAEMPGPTKEGATARMQHTAWIFAFLYCGLNVVLAIIYWLLGMTPFDAMCHAFGTMATGGFSTYNGSLGQFNSAGFGTAIAIEYVTILFMILAGTNFTLLYLTLIFQPKKLLADSEWRVYIIVIAVTTAMVLAAGIRTHAVGFDQFEPAFRHSLFQIVSIITTTGYGTDDFDMWPDFSRGVLLMLMFVGGCAGSTGGGMKVIRHILMFKILMLDMERAFHPRVVRPLRIGGKPVDENLRHNILLYSVLILTLFIVSWFVMISVEPAFMWGPSSGQKLIDCASAVAATLNNIGPGFGEVGPTQNYGHLTGISKLLFVWLMMIGRLEIFSILALAFPRFWRD